MIKNERQYKITRTKADEARVAISELDNAPLPVGLSPEMRKLQLEALSGTLGDFEAELADYDALHDATLIEATGIDQFPTALNAVGSQYETAALASHSLCGGRLDPRAVGRFRRVDRPGKSE